MYLLYTNRVIDFCNYKLPYNANNLLSSIEPAISVITRIELFASSKITHKEKLSLEEFIQIATVYDTINTHIITKTIAIRQEYKTKLPDAIIAATALVYDFTLITRNNSDYKNIQGLNVIDPWVI
ncbi:MAG: type II toxin-antitoxin system VapC family toxin [Cytophagales bacterium]|nr:type II toxin-antitoxin system VapC family toxin [Cytophagales bacterium]